MNLRHCLIRFVATALICNTATHALRPLIVGLNKYSHDASCCIIDSTNGKVLFSQAKERLSRIKHDGGAIGELLLYGLESIDATIDDVSTVVSNNHHHRVLPFERRLPFYRGLKYTPEDYSDVSNLLPNAQHFELSHHLAHAWSVVGIIWRSNRSRYCICNAACIKLNQSSLIHFLNVRATTPLKRLLFVMMLLGNSPFEEGLIVVMDGMGETYKAMLEDIGGVEVSNAIRITLQSHSSNNQQE